MFFEIVFARAMICRGTRPKQFDRSSPVLPSPNSIEEAFAVEADELRWVAAFILRGEHNVGGCIAGAVRIAKSALRSVAVDRICIQCDALKRAAVLLHSYLGYAVQDCALLLRCDRSAIVSACSGAVDAIFHGSPAGLAEDGGIACVA